MVEADQSSYEFYTAFANESNQVLAATSPFEINDSFYVNNKSGEDKNKLFCWIQLGVSF